MNAPRPTTPERLLGAMTLLRLKIASSDADADRFSVAVDRATLAVLQAQYAREARRRAESERRACDARGMDAE